MHFNCLQQHSKYRNYYHKMLRLQTKKRKKKTVTFKGRLPTPEDPARVRPITFLIAGGLGSFSNSISTNPFSESFGQLSSMKSEVSL